MASQIQKSEVEAAEYRRKYFARFPKAEVFIKQVNRTVEARGWVKNRFGRRYYIDRERAYVGVNYLIQGSSADIVKNRMVALRNFLKKEKVRSKLIIQVHDELDFYIHKDERDIIKELQKIMEERQIKAYLATDVSLGTPSWGQKEKICMKCFTIRGEPKGQDHLCGSTQNHDISTFLHNKGMEGYDIKKPRSRRFKLKAAA